MPFQTPQGVCQSSVIVVVSPHSSHCFRLTLAVAEWQIALPFSFSVYNHSC